MRAERSVMENEPQESYRLADLPPENSLSRTIRDLSLNASGYSYLGGTSNITLARVLEPVLHNDRADGTSHEVAGSEAPERDPLVTRVYPASEAEEALNIPALSEPIVEKLFQAYMEYVSLPFPVMHSRKLQNMHERREDPRGLFEISVLHLVYAIGGISLTLSGDKGDFRSEDHYEAAMAHRAKIIRCIDRRAIIYLALASIYCLRAPRNPGPWTMIGLAVKLCVSLGLHRKQTTSTFSLGSELDKRLFWTCYCLDRDINLTTGRPPSICDHDIDCPLPLDLDEDSINPEHFRAAMKRPSGSLADPPTTLAYFIHILKLKRIASDVQHAVYRVDKPIDFSDSMIGSFLDRLNAWKSEIPAERSPGSGDTGSNEHLDTPSRLHLRGSYMVQYHSSIRLLLFPVLMDDKAVEPRQLRIMVDACTGVCRNFKQLHQQSTSMYYSPLFIMSLFLSGLTLIYCAWKSPETTLNMKMTNALADCTVILYVMAERWPTARKYRDAFERLKQLALEQDASEDGDENNLEGISGSSVIDPATGQARGTFNQHNMGIQSGIVRNDILDQGTGNLRNNSTMLPPFPEIVHNIARNQFSMWDAGSFDFNFEALTADATNSVPWSLGNGSYNFGGPMNLASTGFEYPSDYDFDPVTLDFSPSGADMNEYGVILEETTGNRPVTRR